MKYASPYKIYGSISILLTVIVFAALNYFFSWHALVNYILAINATTFALYFWDKAISSTKVMRVPEIVLHSLALIGGSPAAFISQKLLRHKTQKTRFQVWFLFIFLLQALLIVYIFYHYYL